MSGWAFLFIALPAETPFQDGRLVDPLHVAHHRVCFGLPALDHDLWQARKLPQTVNKIDMSTPKLLAETDAQLLQSLNFKSYFKYIIFTVLGKGGGDRVVSK